ncbi:MAG: clostripain-related cysteine peptidase, partial [Anaerolineae bacterium]
VSTEDWTEARRYHIRQDDDLTAIGSDLAAELGEVNMGDPLALADFITWGAANYPANRYALILWDHGAGWNGIAFDNDTADFGQPDYLSLDDLAGALGQTQPQIGVDKLDLIGFDACLMGQLDVFQAVAPFADFAAASEELTPGSGWDYRAVLGQLADEPAMDGARLAQQIAANFADYYTLVEPDDFVTMTAVNLAQIGGVETAVTQLAQTLTADPAQAASAVGDARSGAEAFARVYANEFDRYAAVDLHHLASILAQRSPDEAVQAAAKGVMEAVETAVIANEHGSGFKHSGGIAIYFPRQAQFYDADYAQTTANAAWNDFLTAYYAAASGQLPPPQITLADGRGEPAGVQNPAYLDFEIVGREIEQVALLGGRTEEDGRRRLLEFDTLIPEPTHLPDGSQISEWRDGVHEDFFIWDTQVTYLYDAAETGAFVVMWPVAGEEHLYTVQGRLQRADGDTGVNANLVFDQVTGQLAQVWAVQSDASAAPAQITPQPGDVFTMYDFYLDEANQIVRQPGTSLTFDEAGQLYFDWRPLPNGDYFLGLSAANVAGESGTAFVNLAVDNQGYVAGYTAYLDPYLGFQFLYPDDWYTPIYTGTLLYTSDRAATTNVQVTLYPHLEPRTDARMLKAQTLNLFGPVDVLFEEDTAVAEQLALRTAYGYTDETGAEHTGVFLAFVRNGIGYVVDVDGLQTEEAATITAVDTLAASWRFINAGTGLPPGDWARIDLDAFTVAQPADFIYQEVNDWQRFSSDRSTFVALRIQPETRSAPDVLAALLRDAGAGVDNFVAEPAFRMLLGGAIWERANFSYVANDGRTIWGFLMAKIEAGQEVVAWAEAPSSTYNDLEQTVFLVMIADLSLAEP